MAIKSFEDGKQPWWKWPANKYKTGSTTYYVPWYAVLRRILFSPIIFVGVLIITLGAFLMYGIDEAWGFLNRVLR